MAEVTPLGPILTAHLFPAVEARLLDLLRALEPDDWQRQTVAPRWKVKDVAAHLLDTQVRKLSFARDGCAPSPAPVIASDRDLAAFIDGLNAEGVAVYRRLSPPLLIAWMEQTSREAAAYHASLDPYAPARFGVSWAGESVSANWFDVARELTERWHHQQQIRLALDEPSGSAARGLRTIMTPELYHPVLDCFMRALPFHYRSVPAPAGTAVRVHVSGDCGGDWYLYRGSDRWVLAGEPAGTVAAGVAIPQDIAWRVFTKGVARERAREQVQVTGDAALGEHVLGMLSIVA
jgi:uncharacterized protein (TIGR03083 family)